MEFNRIMVPVKGSPVDKETLKLACGFAKKRKGKIWAVYVIGVKRFLPLDAEIKPEITKAEAVLDNLEAFGDKEGCEITTDIIQSRDVGPAIIDEAAEKDVDLIVLGATYKRRFGQFSLGEVIPYVLKNAACPVILYHQPQEGTGEQE
jgi:nucleotide-binding universal stress UspA family protein